MHLSKHLEVTSCRVLEATPGGKSDITGRRSTDAEKQRWQRVRNTRGSVFRKRFLSIAVPVALQQFLTSSLNLTNNILVGQLGDASVAAVGLANQVYFILNVVLSAIGGGISIYISQFWGSRKYDQIKKVVSLGLAITWLAAMVFFIPSFAVPGSILALLSKDTLVIGLGSRYLRPASVSFLLMTFSICFSSALRSTGNVRLPLAANLAGIIVNTSLNYVLIFGKLGLPALGVAGSAYATVIARFTESAIILGAVYASRSVVSIRLKDLFGISADLFRKFFGTSGAHRKDGYGLRHFHLYGDICTDEHRGRCIRQHHLNDTQHTSCSLTHFTACLIMVGNKIGENDDETAYKYAVRFQDNTGDLGRCLVLPGPLCRWCCRLTRFRHCSR